METSIAQSKKNYIDAYSALKEVYNSYRSNQPIKPNDTFQHRGWLFSTEINTISFPMYSNAFLKSFQPIAVFVMPDVSSTTADYEYKELSSVISSAEVDKFCRDHGLEIALKTYKNIAHRIFKKASAITLSLTEDPEIENYIKVCLNIKIKADIQSLLQMDREFFEAINSIVPDNEREFFVKTYEIIE